MGVYNTGGCSEIGECVIEVLILKWAEFVNPTRQEGPFRGDEPAGWAGHCLV